MTTGCVASFSIVDISAATSEGNAQIAEEANRKLVGIKVYALIDSERLERLDLRPSRFVLPIEHGLNFEMLTRLLGPGSEMPAKYARGWVGDSLMLFFSGRTW